jgi:hypothetical protein
VPFDGAGKHPSNLDALAGRHIIRAEEPNTVASILGLDLRRWVKSGLFESRVVVARDPN